MTESGFIKEQSDNLPRIDPSMMSSYPTSAEVKTSSQDIRNDYFRMISQFALQTGCYPFMYLTTEEAHELNEAQLRNTAPADWHVLDNRGVYFLPPEMNDNPPRMNPDGSSAQPGFVPGFNLLVANWNVENLLPIPQLNGGSPPAPNLDQNSDDNDEECPDYDYADDEKNFARDDRDMAAALAAEGPEECTEEEISDASDVVCLDERNHNMFRPTNAN